MTLPQNDAGTVLQPPPSDSSALPLGTRLGEFEITSVIGQGGFGIVYLAVDHSLNRKVALKEYMPAAFATRSGHTEVTMLTQHHAETFKIGLRSFVNEAHLLAQFDHPSLVKVYRFWEANGTAYMAMPYYDAPTFRDVLDRFGAPPTEQWLKRFLAQLLDALETLHAKECYHRDIAPDNILMLEGKRPVLLDFGAARRVISDMTQALTVILKPGYAPIEQYDSAIAATSQGPWTDLYALASVVYLAIAGKVPPPAISRVISDTIVPLASLAGDRYSEQFLLAIDGALAVRPEQRPHSVAEFRAMLGLGRVERVGLDGSDEGQAEPAGRMEGGTRVVTGRGGDGDDVTHVVSPTTGRPTVDLPATAGHPATTGPTPPANPTPPSANPTQPSAATARPSEVQPSDVQPSEVQPSEVQPSAVQSSAVQRPATQPPVTRPSTIQPPTPSARPEPTMDGPGPSRRTLAYAGGALALLLAGWWLASSKPPAAVPNPPSPLPAAASAPAASVPPPPPPCPLKLSDGSPGCPQMVKVAGGAFGIGSKPGEAGADEHEAGSHQVEVPAFELSAHEVTQEQWQLCVDDGGACPKRGDGAPESAKRPVSGVSWDDSQLYTAWLSKKTGHSYRLPSEAEWEFAARGPDRKIYPWDAELGTGNAHCGRCGSTMDATKPAPVGSFKPYGGLFDMVGNVSEWVQDCWNKQHDESASSAAARGDPACGEKVVKGGAFDTPGRDARPAARTFEKREVQDPRVGFRVSR